MTRVRQAFVSGGANLGDRGATLRRAADTLRRCAGIASVLESSWYETEPVGFVDQPAFLNVVFAVETELSPESLLQLLQSVEQEHGRIRRERWGPRTLDLDLLCYSGETRTTEDLTLPHPRMLERAFVLVPLRELLSRESVRDRTPPDLLRAIDSARVDAAGIVLQTPAP